MFLRPLHAWLASVRSPAIDAVELRRWTLLVAGLSYWGNVVRGGWGSDPVQLDGVAGSLLAHGAFPVLAWIGLAKLVRGSAPTGFTSGGGSAGALVVCLICAVPNRQATIAALAMFGLQIAWRRRTPAAAVMAALLFALIIEIVWTSTYLLPLHATVAKLDVLATKGFLVLTGATVAVHSNVVENLDGGYAVEVLGPCASSFPLASVGLAFVVTAAYRGRFPCRHDLPWIAASLLSSILLTEIRLASLLSSERAFSWVHDGRGATIYTLAATGFAVLFPMLASERAQDARRFA